MSSENHFVNEAGEYVKLYPGDGDIKCSFSEKEEAEKFAGKLNETQIKFFKFKVVKYNTTDAGKSAERYLVGITGCLGLSYNNYAELVSIGSASTASIVLCKKSSDQQELDKKKGTFSLLYIVSLNSTIDAIDTKFDSKERIQQFFDNSLRSDFTGFHTKIEITPSIFEFRKRFINSIEEAGYKVNFPQEGSAQEGADLYRKMVADETSKKKAISTIVESLKQNATLRETKI